MPQLTPQNVDAFYQNINVLEGVANGILGKLVGSKDDLAKAQAIEGVVDDVEKLAMTALNAWHAAKGIPVTPESILTLLPADVNLDAPEPQADAGTAPQE